MKTANGNIVRYFEALKDDKVALTINGESGTISRIDVRDSNIKAASGVKIGTPFSDIYSKAFGNCQKAATITVPWWSARPRVASISAMPSPATGAALKS